MNTNALFSGAIAGIAMVGACMGYAWKIAPNEHLIAEKKVGPAGLFEYGSTGRNGHTSIDQVPLSCFASWWGASGGDQSCPKNFDRHRVTSEYITLNALFGSTKLTTKIQSLDDRQVYQVTDEDILNSWWRYSWSDAITIGIGCGAAVYVIRSLRSINRKRANSAMDSDSSSASRSS